MTRIIRLTVTYLTAAGLGMSVACYGDETATTATLEPTQNSRLDNMIIVTTNEHGTPHHVQVVRGQTTSFLVTIDGERLPRIRAEDLPAWTSRISPAVRRSWEAIRDDPQTLHEVASRRGDHQGVLKVIEDAILSKENES